MPQLVNKRRSRLAVLVVSALVASMLAVTGVSPAAAAEQNADAQATWTACLGPAKAGHGFDDVDMGGVHYDNINCLAYYGISTGKTGNTYDPRSSVTRSQMALFLTRMATVAGVDLGDAMDAGFSDLGVTGADRVDAINRLAAAGIMEGRTATTFDPGGIVTRADMAQHLFAFTDLALASVHIDNLPVTVDGDGTGIELNVVDGDGTPVDDWFGDARRTMPAHVDEIIGAVYELGITTGTNDMVGENGTFEPNRPVTRAEMASFIMRTLGHTNLRPAGVTAQQTLTSTQVSVRDADYSPIADAAVELFTTNYADDVFDARRECIDRYVSNSGFGFETGWEACQIDQGEQRTGDDGNHVFTEIGSAGRPAKVCEYTLTASGLDDPDSKYGIWAWTGDYGDTVGRDTTLTVPESANAQSGLRTPASALLSGGTSYDLKMGTDTLSYTIQLLDSAGNPVGPEPDVNRTFSVTTYVVDVDRSSAVTVDLGTGTLSPTSRKATETMTPDRNGRISVRIPHPDTSGAADGSDVLVAITVALGGRAEEGLEITDAAHPRGTTSNEVAANVPEDGAVTVNIDGAAPTVALVAAVFSDDDREPSSYTISTRDWGRFSSTGNRNEVTLTLFDQYGDTYRGTSATSYRFGLTPSGGTADSDPNDADDGDTVYASVASNGRARIVYTSPASVRSEVQTDTAIVIQSTTGGTHTLVNLTAAEFSVYWAEPGSAANGTTAAVRVADPSARIIVVEGGTDDPEYYVFGTDDNFIVGTTSVSFAQFMEVLAAGNDPTITEITFGGTPTLTWTGYDAARPRDRATWTLAGVCGS
ncbi:MAG: S-layer homology domain-containing protein [bacterium]|nr:S-layer homology domain-containing protein [bacterium]